MTYQPADALLSDVRASMRCVTACIIDEDEETLTVAVRVPRQAWHDDAQFVTRAIERACLQRSSLRHVTRTTAIAAALLALFIGYLIPDPELPAAVVDIAKDVGAIITGRGPPLCRWEGHPAEWPKNN